MQASRYYTSSEMARLPGIGCAGCGECCRGMEDTIVLDPWDAAQLAEGLQVPFQALLDQAVGLHVEEGMILPHLKMQEESGACFFLMENGKCRIHSFRPGICRLYPLGRRYDENGVRYFFAPESCVQKSITEKPVPTEKVRIDKWLGIPGGRSGLRQYEAFKSKWQQFTGEMKEALQDEEMDQETASRLNVYLLQTFYLQPYEKNTPHTEKKPQETLQDYFFEEFDKRLQSVRNVLQ